MRKLKKPIVLETLFDRYQLLEIIGEGGAGRVYAGITSDGQPIAVKVLSADRATDDKRRRFKNEISFLMRTNHPNLVNVSDFGHSQVDGTPGPFYVMPRYKASLRDLMSKGIPPDRVLPLFSAILDGVEAAHLFDVVHRDLKPENILCDDDGTSLVVADFGIARFSPDMQATSVETQAASRLANFQYAAPEQRSKGGSVTTAADMYALGLMLNEMFTGEVPHGTEYKRIAAISKDFEFLDPIVAQLLRQSPNDRPGSVAELKGLIQRYRAEAVAQQRLSQITNTVIKAGEIDDPLALEPPRLIDFDWQNGTLTLTLDRPVNQAWIAALHNMGNYSCVMGHEPHTFSVGGTTVRKTCRPVDVQHIINHFKDWLPKATQTLNATLRQEEARRKYEREKQLELARQAEEARLKVLREVKI